MHVSSNGIRIHVEETGHGQPALLFLHYWGGSARTWRHVTPHLAMHYRTLAMDHRGWGQSQAPAQGYALKDLAQDVLGVIDTLGVTSYVLIGHSMGGKVAQLIASWRPTGLAGLVLVAPAPPSPMGLPEAARHMMEEAYQSREGVETVLDTVLTARTLDRADREQVIRDSLAGAPQARAAWPRAAALEDITPVVGHIAAPTLVIAGELDRVDSPETLRKELLSRLPHAEFQILPGTGHLSPLEAPEPLAALIRDFVAKLPV